MPGYFLTILQLELFVTFESFARVLLRFAALCAAHLGTEVLFTSLGLWYFGFSELWHFVTLESFARPTQVEASSPDL